MSISLPTRVRVKTLFFFFFFSVDRRLAAVRNRGPASSVFCVASGQADDNPSLGQRARLPPDQPTRRPKKHQPKSEKNSPLFALHGTRFSCLCFWFVFLCEELAALLRD
ncbi:hypothetical protein TW95_gp0197 [Pandoravirus inopinatum]|uniref:Uncharacterized protein n=1 Tax=Pandoravirus inopinatum TaxID=1605721 RepID=A0A0B5J817_9VIRU|nr:hypothetical protein TW95_gp0197 [Pandoravirus inopinatum]AJF96931.1 hypothetical protein [Pandoravirus inopinatum]